MARYILIDNYSGFIYGDTADLPGWQESDQEPETAAWLLDATIGEPDRTYTVELHHPHDSSTGYHVYRADIDGSEAVAVVTDGQSQKIIDAVVAGCRWECYVRVGKEDDLHSAASTLGRKGGKSKSPAKQAAVRENGKKGGRPRKA